MLMWAHPNQQSVPQVSMEFAIVITLGKQEFIAITIRAAAVQNVAFNNFCEQFEMCLGNGRPIIHSIQANGQFIAATSTLTTYI